MSTPERKYCIDVYRDNEGTLYARVRERLGSLMHVVCTHIVYASGKKAAEEQALGAHEACEQLGSTQ